jgi:hypothetical protein
VKSFFAKLLKFFGAFVVLVVLIFLVIVNFSGVETRYRCSGVLETTGEEQSTTIYMKHTQWRWWVGLWGDSDGEIRVELPDGHNTHTSQIKEVGDQIQIFRIRTGNELAGNFSLLSQRLALELYPGTRFIGECEKMQ